jgi:hypothetical protein
MGFLDGMFSRAPLKLDRTPEGPRLTDTRSGLSWIAPTDGELIPGFPESPVSPGFDGAIRLAAHPVEVRLRLETVTRNPRLPPPEPGKTTPIPDATPELAHDLCVHYADMRTEGEPLAGIAQPWQLELWRVDGAASTIYPLARPEGAFDMEETHVLVKSSTTGPPRATVFMKLFSTKGVSPALWSDLNGRANETLAWGGTPRPGRARAASFYVDAGMELTPAAREQAKRLSGELRAATVAASLVGEAAANVQKFAFGSDPPDAELDAEVRSLLAPALLEPLAAPLRAALERELAERVKTYRDFRGLHAFLEAVSKELA